MLKLFRLLKPYRIPVIITLILVFIQSLAELYLPTLMADIVDNGVVKGDTAYIWRFGFYMLLVAMGSMICSIAASYFSSMSATGFGKLLRGRVFKHVTNFSLEEFDKIGTASLITRTTNDINQVQQVLVMMLRIMVMAPMMAIGGLIMALSKDRELTLIFVVVIPVMALVIAAVASRGLPLFKAIQKKIDKLNLVLREALTGIRVIRSFNRIEFEKQKFDEANRDLTETSIKVNKIFAIMMPAMMIIMNFTQIAIVWFGGHRIDADEMQVGDLMAFIQYAMQIMFSILMVTMIFVMIPRASASAERINEVLNVEPAIKDWTEQDEQAAREAAAGAGQADAGDESGADVWSADEMAETKPLRGYLEFRDVTFSYPGAEQPAIKDVSFAAKPGEITAIIGGTGAGKSTLVSLIPRFYDVDSGEILIDGVDIRKMTQAELRSKIGFVPQKAVLFTGTVADNIRYGKEEATDEEVRHAAKIAQADEFISKMEEGYNAPISQGGSNVSGGQKQRLSIARALVRRAELLIFDDSFSALDFKTDAKLRAALKQEASDSTMLIVAQRVSTVMDADRIIVLNESEVAGIGTHRELMETCDVYREIVSSQLSEEEIA
ncbi:multidrug ABC transporter ATP-binding protein [Paenibacillus yonginensis]|uniref:Multidrug ABC transporter ATP-binding protein n=1 Tax=Paenibacillus yonginensis TaxID=1462996 RepID=A0A1B1N465_9BACL|nr:ABC transporter ATP-binding protein [Paenibacillus yonginensis]ANS76196.1 multidrug ABC transporter ATP-binding protein [Paenibacillus yonginensis]